jgi:hypothetical protein
VRSDAAQGVSRWHADLAAECFVARLESVEALDGPAQTVSRTVQKMISAGAPKDVLSGAWTNSSCCISHDRESCSPATRS